MPRARSPRADGPGRPHEAAASGTHRASRKTDISGTLTSDPIALARRGSPSLHGSCGALRARSQGEERIPRDGAAVRRRSPQVGRGHRRSAGTRPAYGRRANATGSNARGARARRRDSSVHARQVPRFRRARAGGDERRLSRLRRGRREAHRCDRRGRPQRAAIGARGRPGCARHVRRRNGSARCPALRTPNVVRTIDVGSEDGRHYIAMEYLEGKSLQRVLSRAKRDGAALGLDFLGSVVCDILEGLAHAHAAVVDRDGSPLGIVHRRDVSPHNVLVGFDGRVKVLDFGIAKAAHSGIHTRTGILEGARSRTCLPNKRRAPTSTPAPTSSPSASCSGRWSSASASGRGRPVRRRSSTPFGKASARRSSRRPSLARPPCSAPSSRAPSRWSAPSDTRPRRRCSPILRAALVVCGATPFGSARRGPRHVRPFRRRPRSPPRPTIAEALAIHRRASGEYPVSELAPPSSDAGGDALSSLRPAPVPASVEAPRVASKPAGREASRRRSRAHRARSRPPARGREGRGAPSVGRRHRARCHPHQVGGVEPAAALETLSAFMQVVDDLEQWQRSAVAHLQAGARDAPGEALVRPRSIATSRPRHRAALRARAIRGAAPRSASLGRRRHAVQARRRSRRRRGHRDRPAPGPLARSPSIRARLRVLVAARGRRPRARASRRRRRAPHRPGHARPRAHRHRPRESLRHPLRHDLAEDGAAHTAHVEADGYEPADQAFAAGDDLAILVSLQPKGPRSTTQAHPAAAPPAGPAAPGPPRD